MDTHEEASQLKGTVQPPGATIQLNQPVPAALIYQPIRQVDRENITLINKKLKSIKIDQYIKDKIINFIHGYKVYR